MARLIRASPPITPPTIAPALLDAEDVEGTDAMEVPEGKAEAEDVDEEDFADDDADKVDIEDGNEDRVEVGISLSEVVEIAAGERFSVVVTSAAVVNTASRWSVIGDTPQAM